MIYMYVYCNLFCLRASDIITSGSIQIGRMYN